MSAGWTNKRISAFWFPKISLLHVTDPFVNKVWFLEYVRSCNCSGCLNASTADYGPTFSGVGNTSLIINSFMLIQKYLI